MSSLISFDFVNLANSEPYEIVSDIFLSVTFSDFITLACYALNKTFSIFFNVFQILIFCKTVRYLQSAYLVWFSIGKKMNQ